MLFGVGASPLFLMSLPWCFLLVANPGTTLSALDSRDAVVNRFGPPEQVDEVRLLEPSTNEIHRFEVEKYQVHANYNTGMPMGARGALLLLLDPWLTRVALYEKMKEVVAGHDLAFVYDEVSKAVCHPACQVSKRN